MPQARSSLSRVLVRGALRRFWPRPDDIDEIMPSSPPPPTLTDGVRLELRPVRRRRARLAVGLCLGVIMALAWVGGVLGMRLPWRAGPVVSVVVVIVTVLGIAWSLHRYSGLWISVSTNELQVRRGTDDGVVVERSVVAVIRPGWWWASIRDPAGRRLALLPLQPRREDVLALLGECGWPLGQDYFRRTRES